MPRVRPNDPFNQVEHAYLTFKREVYAQRHNLRLRQRVAEFEANNDFQQRLIAIHDVASSNSPAQHAMLEKWLHAIDTVVLPKTVKSPVPANDGGSGSDKVRAKFFTNKMTSDRYETEKVNYFFDGPVELHILSVLWLLEEGRFLDAELSDACIGMRLHERVQNRERVIQRLFRPYPKQYASWRDGAIECAKTLLTDKKQNVCILSLDFESFFYRVRPDFDEIARFIGEAKERERQVREWRFGPMLPVIERICERYREIISNDFLVTHPGSDPRAGIPIEIFFSPVLANWSLRKFDAMVIEKLNPFYYARYVDDLLFVLPVFGVDEPDPLAGVMRRQFIDRQLLRREGDAYYVTIAEEVRLQKEKCLLHHFDADNSVAGLDNFVKRIRKLSSEFRELPEPGFDQPFKEIAWDLLYDGSEFKWRSVTGIGEDKNELARFLNKRCIVALFTDPNEPLDSADDLKAFFKGRNCLEYHDLWERLFTLLALTEKTETAHSIRANLEQAIATLRFTSKMGLPDVEGVSRQIQKALTDHLFLCEAMANAAAGGVPNAALVSDEIAQVALRFKNTRLARHYFTREIAESEFPVKAVGEHYRPEEPEPLGHRVEGCPRFVPIEELLVEALQACTGPVDAVRVFQAAKTAYKRNNGLNLSEIEVDLEEGEK